MPLSPSGTQQIEISGFLSGNFTNVPLGFTFMFLVAASTVLILPQASSCKIGVKRAQGSSETFPADTVGFVCTAISAELFVTARESIDTFSYVANTFPNHCYEIYISTRRSETVRIRPLRDAMADQTICFLHASAGKVSVNLTIPDSQNLVKICDPRLKHGVGNEYRRSTYVTGHELPLLFSIFIGKGDRGELKISVRGKKRVSQQGFVRVRARKDEVERDTKVIPLVGLSEYQPPAAEGLFDVRFSKMAGPPEVPESAPNIAPPETAERKEPIQYKIDDDFGDPPKKKERQSGYIAVLAIVFALFVFAGLACLYGIYAIKSSRKAPEQRRMPPVSIPPMGASPYYQGVHFPRVPVDV
jgi:hypothetical protein